MDTFLKLRNNQILRKIGEISGGDKQTSRFILRRLEEEATEDGRESVVIDIDAIKARFDIYCRKNIKHFLFNADIERQEQYDDLLKREIAFEGEASIAVDTFYL